MSREKAAFAMEYSAGQDAAFKGIFKQYYEKIYKFCLFALGGNAGVAEDCTQDIFLILYQSMPKLKNYDKIGGWLYKTAGNISKRYAASLRKERTAFTLPPGFARSAGDPREDPAACIAAKPVRTEEERLAEEKAIDRAAATIRKGLKPFDERVLELALRQKRPLKEVAARLNISLSAAKSRASRLRQKISALARELLAD
ncbi:MAG: sigma-70 family RNA polymerase sigma factor [Spirochaetaceae bacterium]|jgi:RNA polymerase sigma factor (sigma-70 family)|nr:sigma-70 family RNA polymerase sigma factor [Spirochaetaceae bacterium]